MTNLGLDSELPLPHYHPGPLLLDVPFKHTAAAVPLPHSQKGKDLLRLLLKIAWSSGPRVTSSNKGVTRTVSLAREGSLAGDTGWTHQGGPCRFQTVAGVPSHVLWALTLAGLRP